MTWLTLGWVSTGLAALSLGGAVYFTLALAEDQSEFNDKTAELCGSATCKLTKQAFYAHPDIKQIKDSGESNATWATVSWIAAGVTGAAAVTCFVIHAMQKPDEPAALPALVPVLHPDMAGLVFTLDF